MLDGQFDWDSLHLDNNGGAPKAVKIIDSYGLIYWLSMLTHRFKLDGKSDGSSRHASGT